jgi:hypothetical protein
MDYSAFAEKTTKAPSGQDWDSPVGTSGQGGNPSGQRGQQFDNAIRQLRKGLSNTAGNAIECLRDAGIAEEVAHQLVTQAYRA